MKKVLLRYSAGLGDAVQFQIVLKHLRYYRPEWEVTVAARPALSPLFEGFCRYRSDNQRVAKRTPAFDIYTDGWATIYDEEYSFGIPYYAGLDLYGPVTKPRQILDGFGIPSRKEWYNYSFSPSLEGRVAALRYLERICPAGMQGRRWPIALVHYEGHSCKDKKDLSEGMARELCKRIREHDLLPVILDGNHANHPLRDIARIVHTQNVDVLACLIGYAVAFIGIDSGPEHLAGTTSTPTMIVWRELHPSFFYDFALNVHHLVRADDERYSYGPQSLQFFRDTNQWKKYHSDEDILEAADRLLRDGSLLPDHSAR